MSSRTLTFDRRPGTAEVALVPRQFQPRTRLNWRYELRRFAQSLGPPSFSYKRYNRRHPQRIGEIPGRARGRLPSLLVTLDTSASISASELTEIGQQIRTIQDLALITIVECDAKIQRVYPFKGLLQAVKGRGGTDLRPVFEPEFLSQQACDGILYFTDGGGPYPVRKPAVPTLWILTHDGQRFNCPWGQKIAMNQNINTIRRL